MRIRIGGYADPNPGSASASTRIRIQGVKSCQNVNLFYKFNFRKIQIFFSFPVFRSRQDRIRILISKILKPDPN